ncbi:MAG: NADP-dependent oxidoreductase [Ginsengibacter sp.]
MMDAQQIVLASRPEGVPTEQNFRKESYTLPVLNDEEVLIKSLYFSVDPYMRGRMNDAKSYARPFQINEPIYGNTIGEIKESRSASYKEGELVRGILPWATESVTKTESIVKIDTSIADATYYLGILGMPGLTAFFGLLYIGKPNPGETVVVSGAAGAVGIIAGQIAKLKDCRVVAIAGSDEKIKMLKDDFHFDEAINYKTTPVLNEAIKEACPENVDIYFDNVGGKISDAVILNINYYARIVLCGQISLYNATETPIGPRLGPLLVGKSALMQGFLVSDFKSKFSEGIQQLSQWIKAGALKYHETVIKGFDKLPESFTGLFSGKNIGKMIVKV